MATRSSSGWGLFGVGVAGLAIVDAVDKGKKLVAQQSVLQQRERDVQRLQFALNSEQGRVQALTAQVASSDQKIAGMDQTLTRVSAERDSATARNAAFELEVSQLKAKLAAKVAAPKTP